MKHGIRNLRLIFKLFSYQFKARETFLSSASSAGIDRNHFEFNPEFTGATFSSTNENMKSNNSYWSSVKDIHRENTLSNRTQSLTKRMNKDICMIGGLNQLFKRGFKIYLQQTSIKSKYYECKQFFFFLLFNFFCSFILAKSLSNSLSLDHNSFLSSFSFSAFFIRLRYLFFAAFLAFVIFFFVFFLQFLFAFVLWPISFHFQNLRHLQVLFVLHWQVLENFHFLKHSY